MTKLLIEVQCDKCLCFTIHQSHTFFGGDQRLNGQKSDKLSMKSGTCDSNALLAFKIMFYQSCLPWVKFRLRYIFKLVRFARIYNNVSDFNVRNIVLTEKKLHQG